MVVLDYIFVGLPSNIWRLIDYGTLGTNGEVI